MDFTPVPAPKQTRGTKEPNPFLEAVSSLPVDTGQALSFTLTATTEKEPSKSGKTVAYKDAELRTAMTQLTEAGNETDRTVRRTVKDNGDGTVTVTFWAIKRIARKGKAK